MQQHEWVLLVPPRLSQHAYRVLLKGHCTPHKWQLGGRMGSRTHRHGDSVAIPVISDVVVRDCKDEAVADLMETCGVSLLYKDVHVSNRAKTFDPPYDATLNPERQRPSHDSTRSATSFNRARKRDMNGEPKFTYVELFAGIGGFGVALDALGGHCVFASELEEHCRRVFQHNVHCDSLRGDIYQVTDEDLPERADLVVGGFPCQPFSALGKQPGLDCSKSGRLFLEIVRVLRVCKPRAFLLENVPGLLEMQETYQTVLNAFQAAGYDVETEVCNSRCLTASARKRLFFVGLQTCREAKKQFVLPFVPDLGLRARDVLDYDLQDELLSLSEAQFKQLQEGKRWRPSDLAWPATVCGTLVSHYGVSVGRGNSQLVPSKPPFLPRRFSARECARLMGFPNTFVLPGKDSAEEGAMAALKKEYHMIGNAVTPPLVAALAGAIFAHFPELDNDVDWEELGRQTAISLALSTRKEY